MFSISAIVKTSLLFLLFFLKDFRVVVLSFLNAALSEVFPTPVLQMTTV